MSANELAVWLKKRWFWVALVLVAIAGYAVGKDWAMADNRAAVEGAGVPLD